MNDIVICNNNPFGNSTNAYDWFKWKELNCLELFFMVTFHGKQNDVGGTWEGVFRFQVLLEIDTMVS